MELLRLPGESGLVGEVPGSSTVAFIGVDGSLVVVVGREPGADVRRAICTSSENEGGSNVGPRSALYRE